MDRLLQLQSSTGLEFDGKEFASYLDANDELASFRQEFHFPKPLGEQKNTKSSTNTSITQPVYLCGNSLGLQPKTTARYVISQLEKWGNEGVEGHFTEPNQWLTIDDTVQDSLGKLVGALPHEVVAMNSLTVNLHLMMCSFYRPSSTRNKILIEKKAFPSDYHAVFSQIEINGYNASECLLEIEPRQGESCIYIEDFAQLIEEQGQSIALVMLCGVQYYTGQVFDIHKITSIAHDAGCYVGFDLAHAVGNICLNLHDWGVDFAVWCSYKYLNCGPGSIGGCFVHEKHTNIETDPKGRPRLCGWWGHRLEDRFKMEPQFIPCNGVYGYRLSNPPVLLVACLRASLDLFDAAGMKKLREKSKLLTAYLQVLLMKKLQEKISIITPFAEDDRGCQLSIVFDQNVEPINEKLKANNIICDVRKPNVLRIAPAPLYNSFRDVFCICSALQEILS